MVVPAYPKIYHIVHVDRLTSIIANGLWSHSRIIRSRPAGTTIGMGRIKARRLKELTLNSHPGLYVGQCVPFYFCPRSVMLYLIHRGNHAELEYRGGQSSIVHLEADLRRSVVWATMNRRRWAFTLSNAGSRCFVDRCELARLDEIDWEAVGTNHWQANRERKQAEFLMEDGFPWSLIERIGVASQRVFRQVVDALRETRDWPAVEVRPDWYY